MGLGWFGYILNRWRLDSKLRYVQVALRVLIPILFSFPSGESSPCGADEGGLGDDSQVLLYDLTEPLPTPDESKPHTSTKSSRQTATASKPSPNPTSNLISAYSLSPPPTPATAISRNTPSPGLASEVLPVRAWTGDTEINNLAFSDSGDRLGCVSGSKLSVLAV